MLQKHQWYICRIYNKVIVDFTVTPKKIQGKVFVFFFSFPALNLFPEVSVESWVEILL